MFNHIIKFRQKIAIQLQKKLRVQVSPKDMLFGSQGGGRSALLWSKDMGDYTLPSMPVEAWPHTLLLQDYKKYGDEIFLEEKFHHTEYYKNASSCIKEYSRFTWCKGSADIICAAKYFVEQLDSIATKPRRTTGGKYNLPVILRRIKDSSMYQVCDGHHRVSRAYFQNEQYVDCFINPWPVVYTPVQNEIISLYGKCELLQEFTCVPEVESWPVTYSVENIIPVIESFTLKARQEEISILDLACSYGALGKYFSEAHNNVEVLGVEHRRIAFELAINCNNFEGINILHDSYDMFLENTEKSYDIIVVNLDRVAECIGKVGISFCKSMVTVVSKFLILYSKNKDFLIQIETIVNTLKDGVEVKCIWLQ